MSSPARLLLVDRQPLFRRGLAEALARLPSINVIGEAGSVASTIAHLGSPGADVAVVDAGIGGDGGLPAIVQAAAALRARLVVVTSRISPVADGVIGQDAMFGAFLRGDSLDDAIGVVSNAVEGKRSFSPGATALFASPQQMPVVSSRQRALLQLMAEGLPNSAIASRLSLSVSSINAEVQSVLRALDASDRTQAVLVAIEAGLL